MSDASTMDSVFEPLAALEHAGRFVATGESSGAPLLGIQGFGTLPLPVVPSLLQPLRAVAKPAPYGRGPETLHDDSVRRCHQVDASRVQVPAEFQATLDAIVATACRDLGVVGKARASLYKLLIYGPGDFFVPHRDTEKEDGMFATLVVTLPCQFRGGALRVAHEGDEQEVDFHASGQDLSWAAFYADCQHEVLPLTSGVRVALVYNMVRRGTPAIPKTNTAVVDRLASALSAWPSDDVVKKAYLLEHQYSQEELAWSALKGADYGRAHALRTAALESGTVAHLAMLSVEEEWSAEELYYRSGRRNRARYGWDDSLDVDEIPSDLSLYELIDDTWELHHWVDSEDRQTGAPALPVVESELSVSDIHDFTPDSVSYYEATGNGGATLTRAYRRAVVVLWPERYGHTILAQQGPVAVASALPTLADDAVQDLVARLCDGRSVNADAAAVLAAALIAHGFESLAATVLASPLYWTDSLTPVLVSHLERVSVPQAQRALLSAVERTRPYQQDSCVRLVFDASRVLEHPGDAVLEHLVAEAPQYTLKHAMLCQLIELAWGVPSPELQAVLQSRLADQATFDLGVDAALDLDIDERCPSAWRALIIAGLHARTQQSPAPPKDLERAQIEGCGCAHCKDVNAFLADPSQPMLTYGVRKDVRRHIAGRCVTERIDVTTREVRSGSPHKIVLTKTQERFEAALRRYGEHVDALEALG